jgi:hypothetical protein
MTDTVTSPPGTFCIKQTNLLENKLLCWAMELKGPTIKISKCKSKKLLWTLSAYGMTW